MGINREDLTAKNAKNAENDRIMGKARGKMEEARKTESWRDRIMKRGNGQNHRA